MKKTVSILLVVCFLMSMTAAAVSAESGVVKATREAAIENETGVNIGNANGTIEAA